MVQVELQIAGGGEPVGSHLAGPDLAGLAAFTLDSRGRVASWPLAAAELFGLAAGAAGRDPAGAAGQPASAGGASAGTGALPGAAALIMSESAS